MYSRGDIAVYPAHGVGVIEAIETKSISGQDCSFLIMRILDNDMTIMIPTNNVNKVGLRSVIDKKKVDGIFSILQGDSIPIDSKTWNKRFRDYSEKVKVGSTSDIAEVMRDLMNLKNHKTLSFGERKMLDNVKNLLAQEIAMATNDKAHEVEERLTGVFDN
ncbi:MAG: CarD family transcriptional regulator [Proteobacteria bacterium]|nr:CarD family transcriptional regulator [Pseudomonadota bacterium]